MLTLTPKRITSKRLAVEFAAAGLPRLRGVAHLSREIDEDGRAVLGKDGKPKKVTPYMMLKCDLAPAQEQLAKDTVAAHIADPDTPSVPKSITRFQAMTQLYRDGLRGDITSFLKNPGNEEAEIAWEEASEFHRDSEFIALVAAELNLTETQVDQMFIDAQGIK